MSPMSNAVAAFPKVTIRQGCVAALHLRLSNTNFLKAKNKNLMAPLYNLSTWGFGRPGRNRYARVAVLLIQWEGDDFAVKEEVQRLEGVFRDLFRFHTERFLLPAIQPQLSLRFRLLEYGRVWEDENTLLIFYYGGHGHITRNTGGKGDLNRSDYDDLKGTWQESLEELTTSDVVFILDSRFFRLSSSRAAGTTEVLFACSERERSPAPRPHSFTSNLIAELTDLRNASFDTRYLHKCLRRRVLSDSSPVLEVKPFYQLFGGKNLSAELSAHSGISNDSTKSLNDHLVAREILVKDRLGNSVYSAASSTPRNDVLLVAEIAMVILEHILIEQLITRALRLRPDWTSVATHLKTFVGRYGMDLQRAAHEALHFDIAHAAIKYSQYVANEILSILSPNIRGKSRWTHHQAEQELASTVIDRPLGIRVQPERASGSFPSSLLSSKTDKRKLEKGRFDRPAVSNDTSNLTEGIEAPSLRISQTALEKAMFFMSNKQALESLLFQLVQAFYGEPMSAVREEVQQELNVDKSLSNIALKVSFTLYWLPPGYSQQGSASRKESNIDPRNFIVLNGHPHDCYTSTCEQYMRQYWPDTCDEVFCLMGWSKANHKCGMSILAALCKCEWIKC